MKVTFCGHRSIENVDEVKEWLRDVVKTLILSGADTFYLGGYGAFDRIAAAVVQENKHQHPQIASVLVLAYLNQKTESEYDTTLYPPLENVPMRFAISKRNQWMVDQSEVVVAYVQYRWGGASATLDYAMRKGKKVIQYSKDYEQQPHRL